MIENFVIKADGLEKIEDFEQFLFEDENIGFFYTDFVRGIPHYHTEYPSVITEYPVIIYHKDKVEEVKGQEDIVKYLGEKYVSVHIPVVAFRFKA